MKIVKTILISVLCGVAVFFICSSLGALVSTRSSDPIGSGLALGFHYLLSFFVASATFAIVLTLQFKKAKIKTIIWVSLIPVVSFSAINIGQYFYREYDHYAFNKYLEEANAPMVNPWETTDKELLLARLQAGEKIDKTNKKGQTLLHFAAANDNLDLMKFAVENGADINKKDKNDFTAAYYAGWALREYLAENGFDLTTVTINLEPLIIIAVREDRPEEVAMLIKHGANPNTLDYGRTPLFWVRSVEVARVLIDAGADVNFKSNNSILTTPIFNYNHNSELEILKLLIEAGADIEMRNESGNTPFMEFVSYAREAALVLLNSGANINVKNKEKYTPLLLAALSCGSAAGTNASEDIEWLKLLVERGADKSTMDRDGNTAYKIVLERYFKAEEIEFLKP